jgi:hypothetical protein
MVLGVGLLAWTLHALAFHSEVEAALQTSGAAWSMPVTPEVYALRANVLAGILATSGAACVVGGFAIFMHKRWATFVLAGAALLPISFPPFTRLVASADLRFDGPSLDDMLVFSLVGLIAAMAWMFRSSSEVSPDKPPERTRER